MEGDLGGIFIKRIQDTREQAVKASVLYQYAGWVVDGMQQQVDQALKNVKEKTKEMETSISNNPNLGLQCLENFYETEEFKGISQRLGIHLGSSLTVAVENSRTSNYYKTKIDMIDMLTTVDAYYK